MHHANICLVWCSDQTKLALLLHAVFEVRIKYASLQGRAQRTQIVATTASHCTNTGASCSCFKPIHILSVGLRLGQPVLLHLPARCTHCHKMRFQPMLACSHNCSSTAILRQHTLRLLLLSFRANVCFNAGRAGPACAPDIASTGRSASPHMVRRAAPNAAAAPAAPDVPPLHSFANCSACCAVAAAGPTADS
jgi:hypothetical protein